MYPESENDKILLGRMKTDDKTSSKFDQVLYFLYWGCE